MKIVASAITYLSIALIAVLGGAAFAFCCYRASLPLEIDPNEAWNAWLSHAIAHLYPHPDDLITNNYPPIYFYLLHGASRLGLDAIYAGRIVSIAAALALSFFVYRAVRVLGQSRSAAGVGAIWFAGTLAVAFTGYTGMNDPHLLALAVMCGGFVWFIAREKTGAAVEPAVLLMVLAGFIKHNIVAIPATALLWLAFADWRRALRALIFGAAACAAGLAVCRLAYGSDFIAQLMFPRDMTLKNAFLRLPSLQGLTAGALIVIAWLFFARRSPAAPRIATLLLLTLASGIVQIFGEGVDVNAYFEFLFALSIGVGLAFGEAACIGAAMGLSPGSVRALSSMLLLAALTAVFPQEPKNWIFSSAYRADLAENVEAVKSEVKRIKAIRGNVSCSIAIACYWAGKPFVWDGFALSQRVATGRWTKQQLDKRAREAKIRFVQIDDRANW